MKEEKENTRLPYEKPALRVIELAAEEIMGACKAGPSQSGPTGYPRYCANCRLSFASS